MSSLTLSATLRIAGFAFLAFIGAATSGNGIDAHAGKSLFRQQLVRRRQNGFLGVADAHVDVASLLYGRAFHPAPRYLPALLFNWEWLRGSPKPRIVVL
jgi:hypothetical protein